MNSSRRRSMLAFSLQGMFLSLALLTWSIYDLVVSRNLGLPFVLLAAGGVIYWSAYLYYGSKL